MHFGNSIVSLILTTCLTTSHGSVTALRTSEIKCEVYSRLNFGDKRVALLVGENSGEVNREKCHHYNGFLIGWENAVEPGEYPHMAAVGFPTENGTGYDWTCAASLISERFLVTAAHCAVRFSDAKSPTVVRLGDQSLADQVEDDGAEPITVDIQEILQHPGYRSPKKYHNIALIKLKNNVEFNRFVRPACLYTKYDLLERSLVETYWLLEADDGRDLHFNRLSKLNVDVANGTLCNSILGINRNWISGISADQICLKDGSKWDSYIKNSGAPVQVSNANDSCVYFIAGVHNFGTASKTAENVSIYALVSHYLDWIESVVWP